MSPLATNRKGATCRFAVCVYLLILLFCQIHSEMRRLGGSPTEQIEVNARDTSWVSTQSMHHRLGSFAATTRPLGIFGNGSITLWSISADVLNSSTLVLAYNVNSPYGVRGLIHIPHFRVRHCDNGTSSSSSSDKCPGSHESDSKVPLYPHERKVDKLFTIFEKDVDRIVSTTKGLVHLTYWDGDKDVIVESNKRMVYGCDAKPFCSSAQYVDCSSRTSNSLFFVDMFDGRCKPFAIRTRKPIRPWFGPCSCETTCRMGFNVSSIFPYASRQERQEFGDITHAHRLWEYPLHETGLTLKRNYTSACNVLKSKTALFESSPYRHASFSHHLFFIPQLKLIFCGVPKVGMTEWLKFFRHVIGAPDYLSQSHSKLDLKEFLMKKLSPEKASALWTDPNWTKAVFIRDPAERLLSAYLDKIENGRYTQLVFDIGERNVPREDRHILNFSEFVDLATSTNIRTPSRGVKPLPQGLHRMTDPHWKPQLWTCGMDEVFPLVDFVGNFKHISSQTKLLLNKVGGWDKWGATYDTKPAATNNTSDDLCNVGPQILHPPSDMPPGLNQQVRGGDEAYKHSTGAGSLLDKYYTTPELLQRVRTAYVMDYQVWDEIKDREPENVAAARDLKCIQSECGLSIT